MKLVFLDRDGVINRFPGNGNYVTRVKNFHFLPGALEAIRKLTEHGYTIFVISNQAGVGKGIFTEAKLNQITSKMLREIRKRGGRIKRVFYSTSRSDAGCEFRKPNIGSVKRAMQIMNKNMVTAKKGYFVGDTQIDVQAGHNAGCKTIFVLSGREDISYLKSKWTVEPDYIAKDLMDATEVILGLNGNGKSERILKKKRIILTPAVQKMRKAHRAKAI